MASTTSEPKRPMHVLMAIPPEEQQLLNARVKNDFLSKRAAAFMFSVNPTSVWANVKNVERSLIQCCELPEDMEEDDVLGPVPFAAWQTGSGHFPLLGGGVLEKGKEVQFLGILANDCRTLPTRSLALAILERTLETHHLETEEAKEQLENRQQDAETTTSQQLLDKDDDETQDGGDHDDDDDDDEDFDDETGQKRRSKRLSRQAPKYKRTKRKLKEENESGYPVKEKMASDNEKWGRLEQFFAAGGLRLLNRWLKEGLKDEIVTKKSSNELTTQTSPTRPLILPICRFLERIPFDKNLVIESKIFKRIRLIDEEINAFLKARADGDHDANDLTGWTTETTTRDTDGLHAIKNAVKVLKKVWKGNAKKESDGFGDPFKDLTSTLRERLGAMAEFEAGLAPRPDWFVHVEEEAKKPKKSCAELAAKERMMEIMVEKERTDSRRKELEEVRRKHSEFLQKLREMSSAAFEKKSSGRRIKWKDGLTSKDYIDVKKMNEVFVFNKLTPANKDMNDVIEGEELSSTMANKNNGATESEEQPGEDMEEDDVIDIILY